MKKECAAHIDTICGRPSKLLSVTADVGNLS